ncbi:putative chromatin remodeler Bromodomain family [Helianthus annuus]|nr:putative chromatin remodeler Bromodomain family [Helianthus annuus]
MVSKHSGKDSEDAGAEADVDAVVVSSPRPLRTSDRLRKRPKSFNRFVYPNSKRSKTRSKTRRKTKTRASAVQIAKRMSGDSKQNNSSTTEHLRRSTRQRKVPAGLDGYTDDSSEDDDLMGPKYQVSRSRNSSSARHKEKFSPRDENYGMRSRLRPRSNTGSRKLILESEDGGDGYEEDNGQNATENGNEIEDNDADDVVKLSMLVCGFALPLVYRPRLLLCGAEGAGLDHLGPAILHELEKFPVHSLGLSSLLSDPSAKTPEEALVHVFGEARRTTPSILYLPQFHLWWENAHEQLRAVLLTLLAELPSDSPILLLGTSSLQLDELDGDPSSVFPSRNTYQMDRPLMEDRSMFFDRLIEAALSISSEGPKSKSQKAAAVPELSKAPKVDTGPKVSDLKAKAEAEGHALRRLRMCLRDVCNRVLYDKRFSAFHYPVLDEDAPNYHAVIQNPMDMATLLQRVDAGKYITCKAFLEDFDLILANAKIYNRDDYNGARIVSRAYELRDSVHGMLSQMDPALVAFCEKIAENGGPVSLPEDVAGSSFQDVPVVQMATTTRASARLRHVQPEVNLDQSYEALKRPKKTADPSHTASTADEGSQQPQEPTAEVQDDPNPGESSPPVCIDVNTPSNEVTEPKSQDTIMADVESDGKIESAKKLLLERTTDYGIPELERLYTRIVKGVFELKNVETDNLKPAVSNFLLRFAENEANF